MKALKVSWFSNSVSQFKSVSEGRMRRVNALLAVPLPQKELDPVELRPIPKIPPIFGSSKFESQLSLYLVRGV
jgi:hypothetical protein